MKIERKQKVRFGALLKKHRMKMPRDMNPLRKVAAACEMNFSTLNDIEKGDGFPTEPVVLKLSEALILSDSERHDLLNKYSAIAEVAPPDIDRYLTTDTGKAWWEILRLVENKTVTPVAIQAIKTIINQMEDKHNESTD